MAAEHTVKAYDDELDRMNNAILEMGGIVEQQLAASIASLVRRDDSLASRVITDDRRVDSLEAEIDQLAVRILALRQPVAVDLRVITASLKIASDLERMGDYAANIAKRSIAITDIDPVRLTHAISRMAGIAQEMIKDVLDSFRDRDVEQAMAVWRRDEDVDESYNSLFRELLTYMMEDPRRITPCAHLLFIAKNIERIGDHATNIAEIVSYVVTGTPVEEERPKGDVTSFHQADDDGTEATGQ